MIKTIVPYATDSHFLELLAHRAPDPPPSSSLAEERTSPLAPPPCGGARFPTLAAFFELPQRSSAAVGALDDHESVAMHDRAVVPGAELSGEVAGTAAEQGRQFV